MWRYVPGAVAALSLVPSARALQCTLRAGAESSMKGYCDTVPYPDCALKYAAYCDPPAGRNPWAEEGYPCQPVEGMEAFAAYCLAGNCIPAYCEDVESPDPDPTTTTPRPTPTTTTKPRPDPTTTTRRPDPTTDPAPDPTTKPSHDGDIDCESVTNADVQGLENASCAASICTFVCKEAMEEKCEKDADPQNCVSNEINRVLCPTTGKCTCEFETGGGGTTRFPFTRTTSTSTTRKPFTRTTSTSTTRTTSTSTTKFTETTSTSTTKKPFTTSTTGADVTGCYKAPSWYTPSCTDLCIVDSSATRAGCTDQNNGWMPVMWGTLNECLKEFQRRGMCTGGGGGECLEEDECEIGTSKRPTFKSVNCYDSKYGKNFGPNWKPSGKTSVEKYLTPAILINLSSYGTPGQVPAVSSWGTAPGSCETASAIFDNFVCAIEVLMEKEDEEGLKFDLDGSIREFVNSGDEFTDKLELAAFFSHKFKETARLSDWEENTSSPYSDDTNTDYPPVSGVTYHGRGPVQISWNFNYGPFSEWLFGDKNILLQHPDNVDPEGPMGFIAAFWFWFTRRQFTSGAPISGNIRTRDAILYWKNPGMNAIYSKEGDSTDYDAVAGLGLTTNVINGGIECNTPNGQFRNDRLSYFLSVASRLGLDLPAIPEGDFSTADACLADRFCKGYFAGCTPTSLENMGFTACVGEEDSCGSGNVFLNGWESLCR